VSEKHRPRRAKGGIIPPAAAPSEAETEEPAPQKSRKARIIIISLAVLTTLLIIAGIVAYSYVDRLQTVFEEERNVIEELDELDDETAYRTPEGTVNILLLGSDSRGEEEEDYREETGEDGERSDAMMLVHIPEDRSGIYVMSIMRDLWVEIPGEGEGRINTALSAGGLDLAIDTVEDLLYTHIDHVVTINFDGFEDLTTALSGVYVENPRPFAAGQQNPAFYPEGAIRLEGSDALRFVRERKSFPTNDHIRVENQQLVMRAIAERFLSGDTLTNPERVLAVLEAILPYMEMDAGLDASTIVGYALDMTHMRGSDIHTFTMPAGEPHTTSGGAQVILPDDDMMDLLRRSLSSENMDGFMRYTEALDPEPGTATFTVTDDDEPFSRQLGRQLGESINRDE
jgi:polyisoprenyl-teichoic acid--peptidoglycan teichoic acid transferase